MTTDARTVSEKAIRLVEKSVPPGERVVVAIEAAYVDLREPFAADRVEHVRDALALKELVQSRLSARANVLLVAFVNDISLPGDLSDVHEFRNQATCEAPDQLAQTIQKLVRFQFVHAGHAEDDVRTFNMRGTRNRATKAIKRALKEGRGPDGTGIVELSENDLAVDTFADTGAQLVFLASRPKDSSICMPRCAGIMAQHYYDIFEYVKSCYTTFRHLWIFDFNRLSEASRVALGAEATTVLHSWPPAIHVRVANCVYDFNNSRAPAIHVTASP